MFILTMVVGVVLSLILTTGFGAVPISGIDVLQSIIAKSGFPVDPELGGTTQSIIWNIRLPRVLLSMLVGASLALSGAALQGLFRNPLADPSIIGITAGAALSAATVIVLGGELLAQMPQLSGLTILSTATFLGAMLSTFLIFGIAQEKRRTNVATMLLGGIAINALAAALTGLLIYLADDAQLRSLSFWTLGSMGGANWYQVGMMVPVFAISLFGVLRLRKAFNALSLGEAEAEFIGIETEKIKRQVVIATSLAVGASVAFCGMIGFIGLVVPHVLRIIGGSNHGFLIPASALGGGILLCWADALARTMVAPAELPIGVLTALAGAPVFLIILLQQRKQLF